MDIDRYIIYRALYYNLSFDRIRPGKIDYFFLISYCNISIIGQHIFIDLTNGHYFLKLRHHTNACICKAMCGSSKLPVMNVGAVSYVLEHVGTE